MVGMSNVSVGKGVCLVTGHIRYALNSLLPLTSASRGFSQEVQAGGEAEVLMLFLPHQIPFTVIVGLHKVRDENEAGQLPEQNQ